MAIGYHQRKCYPKHQKTDIDKNIQNDGHIYYPSRSGDSIICKRCIYLATFQYVIFHQMNCVLN